MNTDAARPPDSPRTGGVIFDLDGTLTAPSLDFDAIRAEIGIRSGPILEALHQMSTEQRRVAEQIIDRHERIAAESSMLQPGAVQCVESLRSAAMPVAVLTRNARRWATRTLEKHGLTVDALRCREDGETKPSPQPVIELCEQMRCDVTRSWMVGDHLFDIQSGRQAGCTTVLLCNPDTPPSFVSQADHAITELIALLPIIGVARV